MYLFINKLGKFYFSGRKDGGENGEISFLTKKKKKLRRYNNSTKK